MGLKLGIASLLLTIGFYSCDKDKDFPETPHLEFREYEPLAPGKVTMRCYFTDGDGDIGSLPDNVPQNDTSFNCEAAPDVTVLYQELVNGVWSTELLLTKCSYSLTPQGQDKALEGDILFNLDVPSLLDLQIDRPHNDSVRYGMRLRDRNGNVSNEVFGPLILPD